MELDRDGFLVGIPMKGGRKKPRERKACRAQCNSNTSKAGDGEEEELERKCLSLRAGAWLCGRVQGASLACEGP